MKTLIIYFLFELLFDGLNFATVNSSISENTAEYNIFTYIFRTGNYNLKIRPNASVKVQMSLNLNQLIFI